MIKTQFSLIDCPFCGKSRTYGRSGVGFEHERRCADCGFVWEDIQPDVVLLKLAHSRRIESEQLREIIEKIKDELRATRLRSKIGVCLKGRIEDFCADGEKVKCIH